MAGLNICAATSEYLIWGTKCESESVFKKVSKTSQFISS